MFNGSRSRGFTLIELLVVIAIIAILAAILFHLLPVLKVFIHRVRGRSASTASSEPLEQGLP